MYQHTTRLAVTGLAAIVFTVAGCGTGASQGQMDRPISDRLADTQPVDIVERFAGSDQDLANAGVKLIKTQDQFDKLGLDTPGNVNLDLAKHDLIVQMLGKQNTGGYWARIDAVHQSTDKLLVDITVNKPADDQMVTQQITYPFAAAIIPETGAARLSVSHHQQQGQSPPTQ